MEMRRMRETDYQHFSHRHLLTPLDYDQSDEEFVNCKACEIPIKEPFHGCLSCEHFLHDQCLDTPRWLHHPSHSSHPLTLLPIPTYPSGSFSCNGCGLDSNSFSFSCAECEYDLHIRCATLPSTLLVDAHDHELKLIIDVNCTSSSVCDVCNGAVDRRYWVYRCDVCDFDCHLDCVNAEKQTGLDQNQTTKCSTGQLEREDGLEPLRGVVNEMMENQLVIMRLQNQLNRTRMMTNLMTWTSR